MYTTKVSNQASVTYICPGHILILIYLLNYTLRSNTTQYKNWDSETTEIRKLIEQKNIAKILYLPVAYLKI